MTEIKKASASLDLISTLDNLLKQGVSLRKLAAYLRISHKTLATVMRGEAVSVDLLDMLHDAVNSCESWRIFSNLVQEHRCGLKASFMFLEALKQRKQKAGSLQKLAAECGVNISALCRVLRGRSVSRSTLWKIYKKTGLLSIFERGIIRAR